MMHAETRLFTYLEVSDLHTGPTVLKARPLSLYTIISDFPFLPPKNAPVCKADLRAERLRIRAQLLDACRTDKGS